MIGLSLLWRKVLSETGTWCCTSTTRDWKTASSRIEHEGLSFLTITLPAFASDFQKSLDEGRVAHDHFAGFKRSGGLPRFLGGFLELVFDRGTGCLLDEPSVDAIRAVRQLTLMFSKLALECSDARSRSAMLGFIKTEQSVRDSDRRLNLEKREEFRRLSGLLWNEVLQSVDEDIYYGRIVPKHGPGGVADKLRGNTKFYQRTWPSRLEEAFPSGEFLLPNWRYHDDLSRVDILDPGAEIPVRVVAVPKTLKTPRIIAVEPTAMQYMQQGILESLLEAIGQDDICSSLVGFDDQVPNQDMAKKGSLDGHLATLDLSEASDRVSNQLVREMCSNFPNLLQGVDATRSRKADVRGHGVIRLAKFASMGSALCFPIEAMVFTTLVFLGIQDVLRRPLTRRDLRSFRGQVRVYGDDIIVPVDFVHSVVRRLEDFGLLVNAGKSFWNGQFRESCGKDYYAGEDVTVVRVRTIIPSRRTDAQEIISTVSLRNQLYLAGYWDTVRWLDEHLEKLLKHYPVVLPSSPVLGRTSFLGYQSQKLGRHHHNPLVKGYVVTSEPPRSNVDGVAALMKVFLKRGDEPFADKKHLTRSGRPQSVNIRLRWASAV